jgi:transcriptional regulator with XRE-family HTH domain
MPFGERLRQVRHEKKITQEQLARRADVPIQQISGIENGVLDPSWSTIHSLAHALGITLNDLEGPPLDMPLVPSRAQRLRS